MLVLEHRCATLVKPSEKTSEKPSPVSLYQVPHNAGLATLTRPMLLCSVQHRNIMNSQTS
jgi:hypothetical protein